MGGEGELKSLLREKQVMKSRTIMMNYVMILPGKQLQKRQRSLQALQLYVILRIHQYFLELNS